MTLSQRRPSPGLAFRSRPRAHLGLGPSCSRAGGASNKRQDGRLLKTQCQSGWRARM